MTEDLDNLRDEFDPNGKIEPVAVAGEMTFLEHLEVFRWTAGRSILAFFIGVVIVGCLMPHVGAFLQMRHKAAKSSGLKPGFDVDIHLCSELSKGVCSINHAPRRDDNSAN